MRKLALWICGIGISLFSAYPTATLSFASDYGSKEECILDRMKGVTSDVAAKAIIAACHKLTAPPTPPAEKLECIDAPVGIHRPEVGKEARMMGDIFIVDVYNPSPYYTIDQITLEIDFTTSSEQFSRRFTSPMYLRPQSKDEFQVSTGIERKNIEQIDWRIVASKGCHFKN